jgi:hypothetical protein
MEFMSNLVVGATFDTKVTTHINMLTNAFEFVMNFHMSLMEMK